MSAGSATSIKQAGTGTGQEASHDQPTFSKLSPFSTHMGNMKYLGKAGKPVTASQAPHLGQVLLS